jgi:hypothetical protein
MELQALLLTDRAVSEASVASGACFACGGPRSTGKGEHVFAKWLQERFKLWNQKLTLLNGTLIPYRHLTVPCCESCNTGFLSKIEVSIPPLIEKASIDTLDEELAVGRWLSKILIGILVKETSLSLDRKSKGDAKILPASLIEGLRQAHFIIQSARKPTTFGCMHGRLPFSLYWYRINDGGEGQNFDLSTNFGGQSIAIQLGSIGIAFINDGGLQMEAGSKGPFGLAETEVSRWQFRELAARIHCKASSCVATHVYITSESPESININQMHVTSYVGYIPGTRELRTFEEWNELLLKQYFQMYLGLEPEAFWDDTTQQCKTSLPVG